MSRLGYLAALALVTSSEVGHADPKRHAIAVSAELRAEIVVEDSGDYTGPGHVSVIERRTGQQLLSVQGRTLPVEVTPDDPGLVITQDFDFDGQVDLAVINGNDSCYGGRSYRVFLRDGPRYRESAAFTELAQGYCGMFQVDAKKRRLHTYAKSGCCYHESSTFDVVGREPRLLEEVSEAFEAPAYLRTIRHAFGQRSTVTRSLMLPEDSQATLVLAFDLKGPRSRRIEVFVAEGKLDYALVRGPGREVELSHALNTSGSPFTWDTQAGQLRFRNGGYEYVIEDSSERLGVSVVHRGKTLFMPARSETRVGKLSDLSGVESDNVLRSKTN